MRLIIASPTVAAAFMYSTLANAYSQEEVNVFAPTDSMAGSQNQGAGTLNAKSVESRPEAGGNEAMPSHNPTGREITGFKQLPAESTK
ncbi:hypothetical protein J2777_005924 [Paraburkholderia graminis]|uniref:hypothetical protein n=1 Tax=Paraburkholderia graminis TaxID=60548 RepID=UPI002862DB72|nr:hypothetical protein [Paraburkholderia graminis]MDR6472183.1 hypothetical protein [Paraburkholderia graminis]